MKDPAELVIAGQHNIGHLATTLQCRLGRGGRAAMRWVPAHGERREITFADLDRDSNRFANVLGGLGLEAGDVFFTFLPKMPEQFVAFLGSLKRRLITGTLFSNFGEEALLDRLGDSGAKAIITKKSFLKKLAKIRDRLPALRTVILVDEADHLAPDVLAYPRRMAEAADRFETAITAPDVPSVLHYTSGSTGTPKGVLHRHGAFLQIVGTTREILGLREGDLFWCTADQGWVTGTSYGIIGPWCDGIAQVHYGGPYDAAGWFDLIAGEGITVWYTAPTALRMLLREDPEVFRARDLSRLRSIFSVGEPMNPEILEWSRRVLGKDVHDTWFQTETGAIMIANRPGIAIRPGSMGKPVTGVEPVVLDDAGAPVPDGAVGNLCLTPGWPSMFTTYLNNDRVYREKFRHGHYFTGDLAHRDADGYYWFTGRNDDVINTAGHLVSPFEVESVLLEVPGIAESGVIGAPDPVLFEKVVAYVSLRKGVELTKELELKIRIAVSNRISSYATPQDIRVVEAVPKNKSGKIMRRLLRAWYTGKEAGDTSTLDI